jgi:hypothetical protein
MLLAGYQLLNTTFPTGAAELLSCWALRVGCWCGTKAPALLKASSKLPREQKSKNMDCLLPYHCTLRSSGHWACMWEHQTASTVLVPWSRATREEVGVTVIQDCANHDQQPLVHLQLGLPGMVEFGQVRSCMSLRRWTKPQ